jgi:hypothetical protein
MDKEKVVPKAELAKLLTSFKKLEESVALLKKQETVLNRAASEAKKFKDLAKFKPK